MKEKWIQLINTIEKDPFETEAFFALMEYVGEASDEDKRRVVQEVERRIKMIARYDADKSFRFRKFSEQEREVLDSLWSTRVKILNVMMLNPTEEEIERLGHQNDKLRELSKDAFAQGRNLWQSLLHSPHLKADDDRYDVEEHVGFCYNDEDSVLKMDNDDYYGSDFEYMLHFHCNFRDSGRYYVGENLWWLMMGPTGIWIISTIRLSTDFVSAISCTRYIVMNIIRCQTFSAWMTSMYMSGCSMSERCINGKKET